jgi:hypothetical protein
MLIIVFILQTVQLKEGEEGAGNLKSVEVPFCSHNQHQSVRTASKYFASLERRKKASGFHA